MFNRNKVQQNIHTAYFDQISQIEVKNVNVDFDVDKLFSQYQMPTKKTKIKPNQLIKYKAQHKKTSESSISTKQRSKNQDDSSNLEKHQNIKQNDNNVHSLKKNISNKIFHVDHNQKNKPTQTTVKKTARKKTIYSEFQKINENGKKSIKSPQPAKFDRKLSKTHAVQQNIINQHEIKKKYLQTNQQITTKKSRQSSVANRNQSTLKKSRSESIMSNSRQRIGSKNCKQPQKLKVKEQNRKIILRDYFGEDELDNNNKQTVKNGMMNSKDKRSNSKSNKDIGVSRQRVESKGRQRMISKLRQRVGSKSRQRNMGFGIKNRFA